jgi:hypothetical protein
MEQKIMKNILFKTKEDYLKLKENWAKYFNTEARHLDRDCYGTKARKLNATHFVLYAIIRGRDWEKCLQGASQDTLDDIKSNLKSRWFYESKRMKEIFNLSDGQIELIKNAAGSFPDVKTSPESYSEDKVEITQYA